MDLKDAADEFDRVSSNVFTTAHAEQNRSLLYNRQGAHSKLPTNRHEARFHADENAQLVYAGSTLGDLLGAIFLGRPNSGTGIVL